MPSAQPRRRSRDRQPSAINRGSPTQTQPVRYPDWKITQIARNADDPSAAFLFTSSYLLTFDVAVFAGLLIDGKHVVSIEDQYDGYSSVTLNSAIVDSAAWSCTASQTATDKWAAPRQASTGTTIGDLTGY